MRSRRRVMRSEIARHLCRSIRAVSAVFVCSAIGVAVVHCGAVCGQSGVSAVIER